MCGGLTPGGVSPKRSAQMRTRWMSVCALHIDVQRSPVKELVKNSPQDECHCLPAPHRSPEHQPDVLHAPRATDWKINGHGSAWEPSLHGERGQPDITNT